MATKELGPKRNVTDDNNSVAVPSLSQLKKTVAGITEQQFKNEKDSNRVVVLVDVSRIDSELLGLLTKRLTPGTNASRDELLAEGQLLGSFMLRAKLARRLGLISGDLYSVFDNLALIRNRCAHTEEEFDIFEDESAKQRIDNIWSRLTPYFQRPHKDEQPSKDLTIKEKFKMVTTATSAVLVVETKYARPISSAQRESIFSAGTTSINGSD